jgi:predicted phosphodiesterase
VDRISCSNRDYEHFLSRFYDAFSETFAGNDGPDKSPFPYAKLIGNVALIGLNSVARHSSLKNPVGSNGRISEREMKEYAVLLNDNEIKHCDHRIVMVHHHLFRRKDESKLHTPPETNMIVERIEQATLKLRGKRKFLKTLNEGKVGMVLHGHVHFTAGYVRKGITCLNGAGSVYPVNPIEELKYNLITVDKKTITHKVIVVGKEFLQAAALMEHDSQLPTALQLVKVA